MPDSSSDVFLDTAVRIGDRIRRAALWTEQRCTWNILVPNKPPAGERTRGVHQLAGQGLYQGAAGIGLFLAELFRITGDREYRDCARGALRHAALARVSMSPSNAGFHAGRVGVAFACWRLGIVSQDDEWMQVAQDLLAPLRSARPAGAAGDVIGGAAGAIPALLTMASDLPEDMTRGVALALGDAVLREARYRSAGWSWTGTKGSVEDLSGFAHGASGYGHALLELFNATGDEWFRHGALQAAAYERRFFDPAEGNWPDFRNLPLSEYFQSGDTAALRQRLRDGKALPPYVKAYMHAWCHGAPGIGLARLRGFQLLGDTELLSEAESAVETTARSLESETMGYSLCHGHLGNAETLLVAANVLQRPQLRDVVVHRALVGRERYELKNARWPCGTIGSESDPSLMLGEAGIGYFFLRLVDGLTPPILCLTPPELKGPRPVETRDVAILRAKHVERFFHNTLQMFQRLDGRDANSPLFIPGDVQQTYDYISRRILDEVNDGRRALMIDAFAVERAQYVLHNSEIDYSDNVVRALARPAASEVDWHNVILSPDHQLTVVQTKRDWRLDERSQSAEDAAAPGYSTAVFVSGTDVCALDLSSFAALVIECTSPPCTLDEIVQRVGDRVQGVESDALSVAVLDQVRRAYDAGVIVVEERVTATAQ